MDICTLQERHFKWFFKRWLKSKMETNIFRIYPSLSDGRLVILTALLLNRPPGRKTDSNIWKSCLHGHFGRRSSRPFSSYPSVFLANTVTTFVSRNCATLPTYRRRLEYLLHFPEFHCGLYVPKRLSNTLPQYI